MGPCLTYIMFSHLNRAFSLHPLSCQRCVVCRDLIAQFVSNTFPGPIYPGYAERLAAGKFEVTSSSPGFPVSGVSHLNLMCMNAAAVTLECCTHATYQCALLLQIPYTSWLVYGACIVDLCIAHGSCLSSSCRHTVLHCAIMPVACCRWDQGFGSDAKAGAGLKCTITTG